MKNMILHTENESNIELKKELEISKLLQLLRNESHRFGDFAT